jgi:hypothetical protein
LTSILAVLDSSRAKKRTDKLVESNENERSTRKAASPVQVSVLPVCSESCPIQMYVRYLFFLIDPSGQSTKLRCP